MMYSRYVVQVGKKKYRINDYMEVVKIVNDCYRNNYKCYVYDFVEWHYTIHHEGKRIKRPLRDYNTNQPQ